MAISAVQRFLDAPRSTKRAISLVYDALAVTLSFYLAYTLRLGSIDIEIDLALIACYATTLVISLTAFIRLGLYRAILRYINQQAFLNIATGILVSSLTMSIAGFFYQAFLPRSVPIIYFFIALILVGTPRLLFRYFVQILLPRGDIKVLIYGSGSRANLLAAQLQQSSEFDPIAFIDNEPLSGNTLRGIQVYPPSSVKQLIKQHGINRIFLALDNVTKAERASVIRSLEYYSVRVQTVPPISEILGGKASLTQLRNIDIEDLLGRDPVEPNPVLLKKTVEGKVILVTGAGGSIGSELCRQILFLNPLKLVLIDRSEYALYTIDNELKNLAQKESLHQVEIVPLLGSINRKAYVNNVLSHFNIDTLFHAAAYKHVPIIEYNVMEGIKNNLLGTEILANAAIKNNVKNFVLISTDKAVRPTNIMGATKRLAEILLQNLSRQPTNTVFSMVRFGNVLGSSGSVVPLFKKQIAEGGPVTVTHPDVTRFFMTVSEAAQLVIQSTAIANSGDLFVLDMGEPVKIMDLVKELALLSGYSIRDELNPDGDIDVKIVGLRPGEKLCEELLCDKSKCIKTEHPRILRASETYEHLDNFEELFNQIVMLFQDSRYKDLINLFKKSDIGFNPSNSMCDLLYKQLEKNPKNLIYLNNKETANN